MDETNHLAQALRSIAKRFESIRATDTTELDVEDSVGLSIEAGRLVLEVWHKQYLPELPYLLETVAWAEAGGEQYSPVQPHPVRWVNTFDPSPGGLWAITVQLVFRQAYPAEFPLLTHALRPLSRPMTAEEMLENRRRFQAANIDQNTRACCKLADLIDSPELSPNAGNEKQLHRSGARNFPLKNDADAERFAGEIRALKNQNPQITQAEASKRLGISRGVMSRRLHDQRYPCIREAWHATEVYRQAYPTRQDLR